MSVSKYENQIFFITPIGKEGTAARKHSDIVFERVLKPLEKELGKKIVRADKLDTNDRLTKIYEYIRYSDMLIVDLFQINPNVMHEIGIAFAWGKRPIFITPKNKTIPFDLRDLSTNFIHYNSTLNDLDRDELKNRVEANIQEFLAEPEKMKYDRILNLLEDMDSLSKKVEVISENIKKLLVRGERIDAAFIEGEEDAFAALTTEIKKAKRVVKTTRFSPFGVFNKYPDFLAAINSTTKILTDGFYRITSVNSKNKLDDIHKLIILNRGEKMTIFLTKKECSFEIVVIDEKKAFIHFRKEKHHPDEIIASTLYVTEPQVVSTFSEIFDNLRDNDPDKVIVECAKLKEPNDSEKEIHKVTEHFNDTLKRQNNKEIFNKNTFE